MKNNKISFILSLISLVGVILLFISAISNKKTNETDKKTPATVKTNNIAFVNIDSALNNYDLYNVLSLQLTQKQNDLQKQLQSKMLSLQNRANQLQQQFSQHLITTQNYQDKAQKLTDEQNQLQQWQDQKSYELQEDQMNMTQRVYDSIISVVNEVNANQKYDLIISNSAGGILLYGTPNWDITDTIITLLNEKIPSSFYSDSTITN